MNEKPIVLNAVQRTALEIFISEHENDMRMVRRAKTILALDDARHKKRLILSRISEKVGLTQQSIKKIQRDFLASGSVEEFLQPKQPATRAPVKRIMLDEVQRSALLEFVNSMEITCASDAQLVTRAKTVLALDGTDKNALLSIEEISRQVGLSRQSVYVIQRDFLASSSIEEFLARHKREEPNCPPIISDEIEVKIIELIHSDPPQGRSAWTIRLIAKAAVERGIVDEISPMTVSRYLKKKKNANRKGLLNK